MIKIRIKNADHEIDVRFPISENELYAKLAEIHAIEEKDAPQSAFVTEVYWPEEFSMLKDRFAIPFEIRQRVGFSYNDILSFTEAPDGRTVIVKREKICDNCAAEKPQKKGAEDTITLFDFLNGLSDEQQKAAFAHLKLKWDRVQGSGLYGRS